MGNLRKISILSSILLSSCVANLVFAGTTVDQKNTTTAIEVTNTKPAVDTGKPAAASDNKLSSVKAEIRKNEILAKYILGDGNKEVTVDLDKIRATYMELIPEEMREGKTFDELSESEQNILKEIVTNNLLFKDYAKHMNYDKSEEYIKAVKALKEQALLKIMMEKEIESELKAAGGMDNLVNKSYDDLEIQTKGEKQYDITYIPVKNKEEGEIALKNLKSSKSTASALLKQIIGKGPGKEADFKIKGANAHYGNFRFSKDIIAQFATLKNGGFDLVKYGDVYMIVQMNKSSDIKLPSKDKMIGQLKQKVQNKINQQIVEKIKKESKFSLVSPVNTGN